MNRLTWWLRCVVLACCLTPVAISGSEMPKIVQKDGRFALLVDGQPYFILGGQIHNSSAWPAVLPQIWPALEFLHANTVEVPVYWEQLEPQQGQYDFTNVDEVLQQARAHKLHVILLWFGTWKNARSHYVPAWVKSDPVRYPRLIDANGRPTDSLSPFGTETLQADQHVFSALLRHLKQTDGDQHTVLIVQVENESGSLDSVRDFSSTAQSLFDSAVPDSLVQSLHAKPGTWKQVFGNSAAESFQAFAVASYIDHVAAAGKAEFPLPMYVNAWVRNPDDLEPEPPRSYPSGGAVDSMLAIYKATARHVDFVAPDIYLSGDSNYLRVIAPYSRQDNPLFVPENANEPPFSRYVFAVLGMGGIGFSVFGIDHVNTSSDVEPANSVAFPELIEFSKVFALIGSANSEIASLNLDHKLKTVLEGENVSHRILEFGKWNAIASFEHPRSASVPSASPLTGVALVAEIGPDEFLVTGMDSTVEFNLSRPATNERWQIVRVEEGKYEDGLWKVRRLLNGDESDFKLDFTQSSRLLHVKLGTY